MTLLAAVLTAGAMLTWRPPGRLLVRYRLSGPVSLGPSWAWLSVAAGVGAPMLLWSLSGPQMVLALTASGMVVCGVRLVRSSRRRTVVRRRRSEVAEVLGLLAAELRAGLLPARSLAGLAVEFPFLASASRAASTGGAVAAALRDAGRTSGREMLCEVAAGWQVAERSGAPLAAVLGQLEQSVRDDREVDREVESAVAPARATGRLMALLPVVGLSLGAGLGGDPLAVLTSTWVGAICAAMGCCLAGAGVAWIERIAASAERDP